MKIFNKYRNSAFKRIIPTDMSEKETIERWQAGFFLDLMIYVVPLSLLLYIPSMILSLRDRLWGLAVVDTIAFLLVYYIFFSRSLSLSQRKTIFAAELYALGLVLLYYLGWSGPGMVYLFAISAFAVIIISSKAGYTTFVMNVIVVILFAVNSEFKIIHFYIAHDLDHSAILTIGLNFIFFNFVLIYSISSLIRGLQSKINSEHQLLEQLQVESDMHKKAKEKAEESDRLKTAFLQNISHEIRTPLNGIIGFTGLLKNDDVSAEDSKIYNNMIYQSSNRLLDMMNNIMELSKIDIGNIDTLNSHLSVFSMLSDIYRKYHPAALEKEIDLILVNSIKDDMSIYSDEQKIHKILSILIENALKFTKKGYVKFGFHIEGKSIIFTVTDTGIGVEKEQIDKMFERFAQLDSSLSRAYEGAGIGLAICKGYVDIMRGSITVDSQKGTGTSFSIRLPLNI